eukprot:gene20167-biopygen14613
MNVHSGAFFFLASARGAGLVAQLSGPARPCLPAPGLNQPAEPHHLLPCEGFTSFERTLRKCWFARNEEFPAGHGSSGGRMAPRRGQTVKTSRSTFPAGRGAGREVVEREAAEAGREAAGREAELGVSSVHRGLVQIHAHPVDYFFVRELIGMCRLEHVVEHVVPAKRAGL